MTKVWDKLEDTSSSSIKSSRTGSDKPGYFRYLTLMSFHVFIQEKVDVAVVEVGVGGSFDATNIINRPTVTGVTSLGLDHVAILGKTVSEIAVHKTGIFKIGAPAYSVVHDDAEANKVVEKRAQDLGVPLYNLVFFINVCY